MNLIHWFTAPSCSSERMVKAILVSALVGVAGLPGAVVLHDLERMGAHGRCCLLAVPTWCCNCFVLNIPLRSKRFVFLSLV
jgi:hypothetical protein